MAKQTGAKRHTHKYHRINDIWHCGLPDCTHFMPLNVAMNVVGKMSICWRCEREFQLTPNLMKPSKPVCAECAEKLDLLQQFLEKHDVRELTPLEAARLKHQREELDRRTQEQKQSSNNQADDEDGSLI